MRLLSLVSAALIAVFSGFSHAGSISFYVAAHEDDWQLFMNPNAFNDVNGNLNDKTVFIYLTAGDNGARKTTTYWQARESGANRSVRFLADAAAVGGAPSTTSDVTINGNKVHKVVYKDTVSYFLRLPDGNGDGGGFAQYDGGQSLQKLYSGAISAITTIDAVVTAPSSSRTYYGWNELVGTLIKIVQIESAGFAQVFANMPDPDSTDDHSDHKHAGIAMQDAMASYPCVTQVYFTQNHTGDISVPINETTDEIINEAATWGAMTSGLAETGYNSTYDWIHKLAVGKNYFQVISGSGACAF